jgi:josephin
MPHGWYLLGWVTLPLKRKHWVALKYIQNAFYNLDSKLKAPLRIGAAEQFQDFLRGELRAGDKELFLVVDKEIGESAAWKKRTA